MKGKVVEAELHRPALSMERKKKSIMELPRLLVAELDYCRGGFVIYLEPLALSRIH